LSYSYAQLIRVFASYYVIRDDMLAFYVNDIVQRLDTMTNDSGWEVRISVVFMVENSSGLARKLRLHCTASCRFRRRSITSKLHFWARSSVQRSWDDYQEQAMTLPGRLLSVSLVCLHRLQSYKHHLTGLDDRDIFFLVLHATSKSRTQPEIDGHGRLRRSCSPRPSTLPASRKRSSKSL